VGAGIGALVLLLGVLELAAHRHAIGHAVTDVVHVVEVVLTVTALTLAGAVVTAGGVCVARRQHARRLEARQRTAVTPLHAWVVHPPAEAEPPAIEARRPPMLRLLPGGQPTRALPTRNTRRPGREQNR
jgi:hypothetical protein